MKPDYKNWVPKSMLYELAGGTGLDIKTPTLIQFNYSTAAYLQAG